MKALLPKIYLVFYRAQAKTQTMARSSVKKVLILGAGYVSAPVVDYLTRDTRISVTVGAKYTFSS